MKRRDKVDNLLHLLATMPTSRLLALCASNDPNGEWLNGECTREDAQGALQLWLGEDPDNLDWWDRKIGGFARPFGMFAKALEALDGGAK